MAHPYDKPIRDIADYVFHYEIDDPEAWQSARVAFLDAIGCAIESVSKSKDCLRLLGPVVPNTVVPDGFKVPGTNYQIDPVKGAFDLGLLIRYLDHSDALWGAEWGHPSDNLAAILAVSDWLCRAAATGEYVHRGPPLTVRTLLTALIKAYEIQGCYQMKNAFNAFGIDHVILVKLASAAVVAWLLGLTEKQTMATISHVWMDGHPIRVYRSGRNTIPRKGWAAADAAMRAVHLALLVRAGQPGAPEALSSESFGFFARAFRKKGFVFERPFRSWTIQNVLFKVMPVEGHGIAAVEATLTQVARLRATAMSPRDVKEILVRTTEAAGLIIDKQGPLFNAADRDHCLQYVVAVALLKGEAPAVQDYEDDSEWAKSAEVEAMREKVKVQVDGQLTRDYHDPEKRSIGSGVTINLRGGSFLSEVLVEYPVGHVRNPRTASAVRDKLWTNMQLMFSASEIDAVFTSIEDDDTSIMDLVDLLSRTSPNLSKL